MSDPAKARIKYSIADFQNGWLTNEKVGDVLAIEPMADFKQRPTKMSETPQNTREFLKLFYALQKEFSEPFLCNAHRYSLTSIFALCF